MGMAGDRSGRGIGDVVGYDPVTEEVTIKGDTMWLSVLEELLPVVLAVLQTFLKNPQTIATEVTLLTAIRDTLNTLLSTITPTPTPPAA